MNQSWLEDQVLPDPVPGRPILTIVMRVACAACLLMLLAFAMRDARADSSVQSSDGSVKYVRHEAKCEDADIVAFLLKMGAAEYVEQFKKGTLTYGGREWRSCWLEMGGQVFSIDEEGSPLQPLPAILFKPVGTDA